MSMFSVIEIASSGMHAQMIRMNSTASNLANASVVSNNENDAYKARKPVFRTIFEETNEQELFRAKVRVDDVVNIKRPHLQRHEPSNPLANKDGYVFLSNVNTVEEMVDMTVASRSYQTNTEVINTAKRLVLNTLNMGN